MRWPAPTRTTRCGNRSDYGASTRCTTSGRDHAVDPCAARHRRHPEGTTRRVHRPPCVGTSAPVHGLRHGSAQRSGQEARRRRTAESPPRGVVVGDFNGTIDDTALRPLTAQLRSAQEAAGDGFGFSWPAAFPVAGIDQILVKGVTPVSARTLPRTGRDHLPVAAALRL
ncbi:endonuclease/exonuclease/phosphatase family protein [Streptomyces sp. NPDC055036]